MNSFLKEVAKYINSKNPDSLHNIIIFMPNRRSCLFLQKEFQEILKNKTSWLPKIITFRDWINDNSILKLTDELTLLLKLYQSYKKVIDENIKFNEFYYIGKILLDDFNEIDLEYIDANVLYKNLKDYKNLDHQFPIDNEIKDIFNRYSFILSKENKYINNYLKIWENCGNLYSEFTNNLLNEKIAYDGLQIKYFLNNELEKLTLQENVYFVGFNILRKAELNIIDKIFYKYNTHFFWNYDEFYLNNNLNTAGDSLRKLTKKYPEPNDFKINRNNIKSKTINLYEFANEYSQVKYLPVLLEDLKNKELQANDCVIVLLNENLLPAVLNSLPNFIQHINITMGYPIEYTHTYSFIRHLFKIKQKNINGIVDSSVILNFLYHPFVYINDWAKQLTEKIIEDKKPYYKISESLNNFPEEIKSLVIENRSFTNIIDSLLKLLENQVLDEYFKTNPIYLLEKQAISKISNSLVTYKQILENKFIEIETNENIFFHLLWKIINSQNINLYGEPIKGLQIMGLMETRLLDFKKVIILSANNEYLPQSNIPYSFILQSVRNYYGLMTQSRRQAIDSYHFNSLLQQAEEIHICYANITNDKPAEVSPYLLQLKYENINVIEHNPSLSFEIKNKQTNLIEINKKQIPEIWNNFITNTNELSRNAINDYLYCSLRFYFKRLLKLTSENLFIEEKESSKIGTLTDELVKEILLKHNIISSTSDVDKILATLYNLSKNKPENSTYEIIYNIKATEFAEKAITLLKDNNIAYPIFIEKVFIEKSGKKLKKFITLPNNRKICLTGYPDLIIRISDTYYILDLKATSAKTQKIKTIDDIFSENFLQYEYAFQNIFYAYLFHNQQFKNYKIYGGNIFTINQKNLFDYLIKNENNTPLILNDIFNDFENKLINTLNELFNENINFSQTTNLKACEKCDYNIICKKI